MSAKTTDQLREEIAKLVAEYAEVQYAPKAFEPGTTVIPPAGKVMGEGELQNMVAASLDGWLTTGRFNDAFEKKLAEFLGVKFCFAFPSRNDTIINFLPSKFVIVSLLLLEIGAGHLKLALFKDDIRSEKKGRSADLTLFS